MIQRSDVYHSKHRPEAVDWFFELMDKFPELEFTKTPVPWHFQCRLPNGVLINFWPSAGKVMAQGEPPVKLWWDAEDLLRGLLLRQPEPDPVLDDEDDF